MDAIYLKLDGIEGESRIKGFENQIKLIAYNHNPTKRESGEARGTLYWRIDADKACRSCYAWPL
ncbi:Uncharacterised protein [Salmonella enterica subsp. enterica]|nr:Uncharacterised protein [Salmonella enterica subsp. enterica]